MRRLPVRVVKVGGSLLSWSDLPNKLSEWLRRSSPACNVLVVGGGSFADTVRAIDRRFGLTDGEAHELAIRAMSVTSACLSELMGDVRYVDCWHELKARRSTPSTAIVFDAAAFLERFEPHLPGQPLRASWDVTSDSIAARLATCLAADELVLLKSVGLPRDASVAAAADVGLVDRAFPEFSSARYEVRWVNLRSESFAEARLAACEQHPDTALTTVIN